MPMQGGLSGHNVDVSLMEARSRSWWGVALTVAVCAALLAAAGVHLAQVQSQYGVWAWSPGEATPQLPFAGRTYLRGADQTSLPPDLQRLDAGPKGSTIYGAQPIPGAAATGLYVRFPDGRTITYGLSGGP